MDVAARVPQSLSDIVMRCLAKTPASRYSRGYELADALIGFVRGQPDTSGQYRAAVSARRVVPVSGPSKHL
jgi:serine/threonine-protein kinase